VRFAITGQVFLVVLLCLLQACSSQPTQLAAPPVVDKGQQAPASQSSNIAGRQAPSTVQQPRQTIPKTTAVASQPPAVIALLDQAEKQANAGELEPAAASLERAIRIDPRNAVLWYHLATVRLSQGESEQAEQLAVKSNSLASGSKAQQARNWRLIGQARREQNNPVGAAAADDRADELERR
jgi:predicted Zn-dependent protease